MDEPQRYTILVVDDNEDVRRLLRKVLVAEGYDVIEAADGSSALEELKQKVPDLVLMDVKMPGELDGMETTERIRQDSRLGDIPVVALTASVMKKDKVRAEEAGCNGFIGKPIDIADLPLQVRRFIEQSHNAA